MSSRDHVKRSDLEPSPAKPAPSAAAESSGALVRLTAGEEARRRRRAVSREARHGRSKKHSNRDRHDRRPRQPAEETTAKHSPSGVDKPPPQDGSRKEPVFVVDTRGDPFIRQYKANDPAKIPRYRRFTHRRVLGSDEPITITQDGSKEAFSTKEYRERGSIFRHKHLAVLKAALSKSDYVQMLPTPEVGDGPSEPEDYVPLSPSAQKTDAESSSSDESDEGGLSYRTILGKGSSRRQLKNDTNGGDDLSQAFDTGAPIKGRREELREFLQKHPHDINSWIELAGLADTSSPGQASEGFSAEGWTEAVAEERLTLLREAQKYAESKEDRVGLSLRIMRELARLEAPAQLSSRWESLVREHEDSFEVWRAQLDFEMTNMATFSFERVKDFLTNRLKRLRSQLSVAGPESVCQELAYVFLRTTRFLEDSGFPELATAAWQAQLELTFARPNQLGEVPPIISLEKFWDSEVSRIGEKNAKGWAAWVENPSSVDIPLAEREEVPQPKTKDVYKAWAAVEQQRAAGARLPARTLDEDGDSDPYRVVMFSDISELLFDVAFLPMLTGLVRGQLIDFFLLFCRLPPAFVGSEWVKTAMRDPFVTPDGNLEITTGKEETESAPMLPQQLGNNITYSPEVLFAPPGWFSYFPSRTASEPTASFATETLRQLAGAIGKQQQLSHYYLALEWHRRPNEVKKVAKALLKLYPSNIYLYNSYALAEFANGNTELAYAILQSMTAERRQGDEVSALLPWQSWAWMELEAGRHDQAIARICSSVGEPPGADGVVTPSQLLRAREKLRSGRDYSLSLGRPVVSAAYAQPDTLLEYLTAPGGSESASARQGNISAAMARVHGYADEYRRRQPDAPRHLEVFLQFAARLLHHHATRGPHRPAYLRAQFRALVGLFPQNTMFLGLYAWSEPGPRVHDPVRALLRTAVLTEAHDGPAARAFAVRYELRVGNAHSARAALEDAVAADAGRGCAGLWVAYVRLCRTRRELRPRARAVFDRAVQACPWSKEVLMEAFTTLVADMSSADLRAVYATMRDKGMRLHVDLEDFVEARRAAEKQGGRQGRG